MVSPCLVSGAARMYATTSHPRARSHDEEAAKAIIASPGLRVLGMQVECVYYGPTKKRRERAASPAPVNTHHHQSTASDSVLQVQLDTYSGEIT